MLLFWLKMCSCLCRVVYSPIHLTEEIRKEIEEKHWEVKYIIAPNCIHHLFIAEWQKAYPKCELIGEEKTVGRFKDKYTFHHTLRAAVSVFDQTLSCEGVPQDIKDSGNFAFCIMKTGALVSYSYLFLLLFCSQPATVLFSAIFKGYSTKRLCYST